MAEKFCYWHIVTEENPEGTDCSANLAEGRCFKCPYKTLEDRNNADYPCSGYKPVI